MRSRAANIAATTDDVLDIGHWCGKNIYCLGNALGSSLGHVDLISLVMLWGTAEIPAVNYMGRPRAAFG